MTYDIKRVGLKHLDWVGVILTTNLPSQCKYLALYLSRFMNSEKTMAWPSLIRISTETSLSKSSVCRYLKYLENEHWLTRRRGNSTNNTVYLITFPEQFISLFGNSVTQTQGSVRQTQGSVTQTLQVVSDRHTNRQVNRQIKKNMSGKPDEVIENSLFDKNNKTNATKTAGSQVLAFLNELTGHNYQQVEANLNLIQSRLTEAVRQFGDIDAAALLARRVCIDRKHRWSDDEKMAEYLRPATLFSKKNFWNYAGQLPNHLRIKQKIN